MTRLSFLAFGLLLLGGCGTLNEYADRYGGRAGNRYPDSQRYPDSRRDDRYDDYSRTDEYRRITQDADDYARRVDDQLRVGSGQERRIRDLLVDRTARLLQQTRARDHRAVYPFPRRFRDDTRAAQNFWSAADRDIERILGRQDAEAYRYYDRNGGRYDPGRYGQGRYDQGRANPGNGRYGQGNGRYDRRDDDGRDDRGRDNRGRDDGERGDEDDDEDDDRAARDRADRDRADRDRADRDRATRDDAARRPGESLPDWYRRQARRGGN